MGLVFYFLHQGPSSIVDFVDWVGLRGFVALFVFVFLRFLDAFLVVFLCSCIHPVYLGALFFNASL